MCATGSLALVTPPGCQSLRWRLGCLTRCDRASPSYREKDHRSISKAIMERCVRAPRPPVMSESGRDCCECSRALIISLPSVSERCRHRTLGPVPSTESPAVCGSCPWSCPPPSLTEEVEPFRCVVQFVVPTGRNTGQQRRTALAEKCEQLLII
jgi:hypothetical protein